MVTNNESRSEQGMVEPQSTGGVYAREKELTLIQAAKEGDEQAFATLLEQYTGFIYSLASKHSGKSIYNEYVLDLFQEGAAALSRAVQLFDPSKNVSFATYAYQWVEQAIDRCVVQNSGHIKLSMNRYRQLAQALSLREQGVNDQKIAEELGVTKTVLADIFRAKLPMSALEGDISEEGGLSLHDVLEDGHTPLDDMLSFGNGSNKLYQWMDELEPQMQQVVAMRWGLYGQAERTFEEIAQIMRARTQESWNKEGVRQMIMRAEDLLGRKAVEEKSNVSPVSSLSMFAQPKKEEENSQNTPRPRL